MTFAQDSARWALTLWAWAQDWFFNSVSAGFEALTNTLQPCQRLVKGPLNSTKRGQIVTNYRVCMVLWAWIEASLDGAAQIRNCFQFEKRERGFALSREREVTASAFSKSNAFLVPKGRYLCYQYLEYETRAYYPCDLAFVSCRWKNVAKFWCFDRQNGGRLGQPYLTQITPTWYTLEWPCTTSPWNHPPKKGGLLVVEIFISMRTLPTPFDALFGKKEKQWLRGTIRMAREKSYADGFSNGYMAAWKENMEEL